MINNWLLNIQDWLWPRLCPACGTGCEPGSAGFCAGCEAGLPLLTRCCPVCAMSYEHPGISGVCGRCQRHPPTFRSTLSLYHYAPPVDHCMRAIKFQRDLGLARLFGHRLAQSVLETGWRPEVILPVPLHPARLRSRGYNQALELARPTAKWLGLKPDIDGIVRVRDTPAQAGLDLKERHRNLRGAFRAHRDYTGKSVAIVDDVMTTGQTAETLAQCLVRAGAREIRVWVIARA